MKKIPTAEEMEASGEYDDYSSMMRAFAKLHVAAALDAAYWNVRNNIQETIFKKNIKSLCNDAYPLSNIK